MSIQFGMGTFFLGWTFYEDVFTEGRFFLGTLLPGTLFPGDVFTEGRFYRIPWSTLGQGSGCVDRGVGRSNHSSLPNRRPCHSYCSCLAVERSPTACDVIAVASSFSVTTEDGILYSVIWPGLVLISHIYTLVTHSFNLLAVFGLNASSVTVRYY
jgi:hypothetical protein